MIKTINPPNVGWLEKKLSDQEMDYLWKCIDNKKGDHRSKLAGNISESYLLMDRGDWFWLNTLKPLCAKYKKEFYNLGDDLGIPCNHPYYLHSWWVNYQNQTDFNPVHTHGGIYSFVIWLKIPIEHEEQNKDNISNMKLRSSFQFNYTDILGNISQYSYDLNKSWEGIMLFFPSQLQHQVYPFYNCDEERISISGNILVNSAKRL